MIIYNQAVIEAISFFLFDPIIKPGLQFSLYLYLFLFVVVCSMRMEQDPYQTQVYLLLTS